MRIRTGGNALKMSDRIWNILVEGFGKIMLASVRVTIPLTILGFGFAMVIAMFMAMVQYAKIPVLRQISRIYIWIFRGTPLLVQLFLAYYGFPKVGIVLDSFVCAVIVFSLNEGAYCAECRSCGMSSSRRHYERPFRRCPIP